jgi:hypothetical protein
MLSVPHACRQTDGKGVDEKLLVTGRVDSSFVLAYIDERLEGHSLLLSPVSTLDQKTNDTGDSKVRLSTE